MQWFGGHMADQTLQIKWFDSPRLTNRPYTMASGRMTHQTLHIHWFDFPWHTKRYIYHGVGANWTPNLTNTLVLISMAHTTLHIQRFATHGSPNLTNTFVFNVCIVFRLFQFFKVVLVLHVFLVFHVFHVLQVFQVFH